MSREKQKNSNMSFEKIAIIVIALIVAYAAVISTLNFTNKDKVGYVNSGKVLSEYSSAIIAEKSLNQQIQEWNKNIEFLENEILKLNDDFEKFSSTWTSVQRKEKQQMMLKKQQEFADYNKAVKKKAEILQTSLMEPVYDEINAYMQQFGQENGYRLILGTLSGGNILFGHDSMDLTSEFLAYANSKSKRSSNDS